jgi:hypothetical protein
MVGKLRSLFLFVLRGVVDCWLGCAATLGNVAWCFGGTLWSGLCWLRVQVRKVFDCLHLFVANGRDGSCGGRLVDCRDEILCRLDCNLISGHVQYLGMLQNIILCR